MQKKKTKPQKIVQTLSRLATSDANTLTRNCPKRSKKIKEKVIFLMRESKSS